jgi:hypothetical protein
VATRYKQPSRINSVSIALVLVLGLGGWVGISAWPVIAANANLKTELDDALPRAYRANLLPEPTSTNAIAAIHDELIGKLPALGVTDPKCQVVITRDTKAISIEARYRAELVLRGTHKSYPLSFNPRVETDAARVQW